MMDSSVGFECELSATKDVESAADFIRGFNKRAQYMKYLVRLNLDKTMLINLFVHQRLLFHSDGCFS